MSRLFKQATSGVDVTDYEAVQMLLSARGIQFTVEETKDGKRTVEVEDGYIGFSTSFDFDREGNLTRVSAWES